MSRNPNRFTIPTRPKAGEEKITVAIIGSRPVDGMRSKPAIGMMYIENDFKIIDAQVSSIVCTFPKADIMLICGHDINRIVNFRPTNLRLVENQLYEESGEAEDVRIAVNNCITDSLLLISSNVCFNAETLSQLKGTYSSILVGNQTSEKDRLGVISNNSKVTNIAFGVGNELHNVILLKTKELGLLRKFTNNRANKNMCMFEAINYIVNRGGSIKTVQNNHYIKTINSSQDLSS